VNPHGAGTGRKGGVVEKPKTMAALVGITHQRVSQLTIKCQTTFGILV